MSIWEHDEDAAALAEALAFVDEFSLPPIDFDRVPWAPVDVGHDVSSPVVQKKRVRDPAADARRRQRRKEEREALRQQVKDLERQLIKARRAFQPRSVSSDATDGDESDRNVSKRMSKRTVLRWHKTLVEEHRKRCLSEALNAKLKNAVAAQAKASQSLQECLKQFTPVSTPNVRPAVDLPAPSPVLDADSVRKVLDELQVTVQRLYHEANATWDPSLAGSVTNEFSVKVDPVVGRYCQISANAPLGRGLADVTDLIRIGFLWTKFPMASSDFITGKVTTLKKQSNMDIAVEGGMMRLHGIGVLLWSQEADRVVLTYSSLMFHPSGKFCFREGGWLIVQQSLDNTSECMYQSRCRLASEMLRDASVLQDKAATQAHSDGVSALATKVKAKYEAIQHRLLVETGREDLARLLPDSPGVGPCSCGSASKQ